MIRWTFFFDEGCVKSEIKDPKDDERIAHILNKKPDGMLFLGENEQDTDLYVNLKLVKCIFREKVKEEEVK